MQTCFKRSLVLIAAATLVLGLSTAAGAQPIAFAVERMVVCEDVIDRTPVNVAEAFPAETETVFCFLEARDIQETTTIRMVWYHEEEELASVPLVLRQGPRWRTFASKRIMGRKGNWKVYLVDDAGNSPASVQFVTE